MNTSIDVCIYIYIYIPILFHTSVTPSNNQIYLGGTSHVKQLDTVSKELRRCNGMAGRDTTCDDVVIFITDKVRLRENRFTTPLACVVKAFYTFIYKNMRIRIWRGKIWGNRWLF